MNLLFQENGCLTDEALMLLIGQTSLDELARLEISEHLSFCDKCIDRYTQLLEGSLLLEPEQPAYPTVTQKLRQKARRTFASRYFTAAAAACLALIFWHAGFFSMELSQTDRPVDTPPAAVSVIHRTNEKIFQFSEKISSGLDQFINSIRFERGHGQNEKK